MGRSMMKEAKLQDIKQVAFRGDGKALVTLTSHASLCRCIEHFNGMPWFGFEAPMCSVPTIIAKRVKPSKSSKASKEPEKQPPHQQPAMFDPQEPAFVTMLSGAPPGLSPFDTDNHEKMSNDDLMPYKITLVNARERAPTGSWCSTDCSGSQPPSLLGSFASESDRSLDRSF